jgi:threonine/homoserine/homoserine lactone efflux protein
VIASQHLVPYLVASILIILAPGPSVMFTIARAIAFGRWISFLTVCGNAAGMLLLSALVAVGLGPLLQSSQLFSSCVQWAGGTYLVYLGIDALRHRVVHAENMTNVTEPQPSQLLTLRQGFVVGVLNPKAIVFFAAVLPQFVDRTLGSVTLQLLTLGAIFSVLALLSDGTWGVIAGTARSWFASSPQRLVVMRIIGGCVMIFLGVAAIVTAPLPWAP